MVQTPGDIVRLAIVLSVLPSCESVHFQQDDLLDIVHLICAAQPVFSTSSTIYVWKALPRCEILAALLHKPSIRAFRHRTPSLQVVEKKPRSLEHLKFNKSEIALTHIQILIYYSTFIETRDWQFKSFCDQITELHHSILQLCAFRNWRASCVPRWQNNQKKDLSDSLKIKKERKILSKNSMSAFEPGTSGLPYYCTPPVCVPDVLGALAVWMCSRCVLFLDAPYRRAPISHSQRADCNTSAYPVLLLAECSSFASGKQLFCMELLRSWLFSLSLTHSVSPSHSLSLSFSQEPSWLLLRTRQTHLKSHNTAPVAVLTSTRSSYRHAETYGQPHTHTHVIIMRNRRAAAMSDEGQHASRTH